METSDKDLVGSAVQDCALRDSGDPLLSPFLQCAFVLDGPVDVAALEAAFRAVVAGDPALNVEALRDDQGVRLRRASELPVEITRSHAPLTPRNLDDLRAGWIPGAGFAPQGVTARLTTASLTEAPDRLAVTIGLHRGFADAASLPAFAARLSAAYGSGGRFSGPVPDYYDICALHRLRPGDWGRDEAEYWARQLADGPSETAPLPLFPADAAAQGVPVATRIDGDAWQSVVRAAAALEVPEQQLVFAAYLLTIARQTGRASACAGCARSGREGRPAAIDAIGLLGDTLPILIDIRPGETGAEFVRRVGTVIADAVANARMPACEIEARAGYAPYFGMSWRVAPVLDIGGQRMSAVAEALPQRTEIHVDVRPDPEGVALRLGHHAGATGSARARLFLDQLAALVSGLAADPGLPVEALATPGPEVVPVAPAVAHPSLWDRVAARIEASPDAVAISSAQTEIRYRALGDGVAQLAARMAAAGVAARSKVALRVERGPELVMAILAASRLGAVFSIYDPSYPASRTEVMDEVFGPEFILRQAERPGPDALLGKLALVKTGAGKGAPLPPEADYALFTSGTTGKPKCVVAPRAGLISFLDWHIAQHGFGPEDRFALIGGLGHDPMMRDVFTPLFSGGRLYIPPVNFREDPRRFFAFLQDARITVLHLTPQMWKLIDMGRDHSTLPALREVFFGGDKLFAHEAAALFAAAPLVSGNVVYGLTETPQAAALYRFGAKIDWQVAPIGRGVNGRSVRVERGGRPAGYGEVGEIVVEAADLFLGYYDAGSGMSAEAAGPTRAMKTGDTGLTLASGDIAIIGRSDNQVKVRGYRVEPDEIAVFLRGQPGVDQAAVIAAPAANGENELIAYVTPAGNPGADVAALTATCRRDLPKHMVPSSLMLLDALPLTANGKLDRARLPRPAAQAPAAAADYAAPVTEAEKAVVGILETRLDKSGISVETPVQSLGVDSLTYLSIMLDLEKELGELPANWAELSLRQLAASRTGRSLFSHIETTVLMRALAIINVVIAHFGIIAMTGETSALFFIAGHSFGRFQTRSVLAAGSPLPILNLVWKVALPTILFMLLVQGYSGNLTPVSWLLVGNWIGPDYAAGITYWYVDVLLQMLLVLAALFAFAPVRSLVAREPFWSAVGFAVLSFALALVVWSTFDTDALYDRIPPSKFWLLGLGWTLAVAETRRQRLIATALSVAIVAFAWLGVDRAEPFALAAFAVILSVERVKLPRHLTRGLSLVASASLYIYLTHFHSHTVLERLFGEDLWEWGAVAFAVAIGVLVNIGWDMTLHRARQVWNRLGVPRARRGPRAVAD
ncbi:MAG: AMP-binding protein [Maritimibacter sp.]|nr:AMP-binding protein [Maritimibacter sp.]